MLIPNIKNGDTGLSARTNINASIDLINKISQNVYKVTYFEIITGASGTIMVPSQATINANEFGNAGNAVLAELDVNGKPTDISPKTSGGVVVTTSLDPVTGNWIKSGTTASTNVALIYSINITEENYQNLDNFHIIETVETGKENEIISGTTDQYWRGDKTWQSLSGAIDTRLNAYTGDVVFSTGSAAVTWANGYTTYDARYLKLSGGTLTGALTLSGLPTNALHAATKSYVDNAITGLSWKQEVRAATTANITLSGTQTIDTIVLSVGDRVLVKNQSTASQNGIYLVSAGSWTRTTDADTTTEIETATMLVRLGTVNADTQWTCTNSNEPVIGTDAITFGQIAGAGVYTNGSGITLTGNVFSIGAGAITNSMIAAMTSAQFAAIISDETGTGFVTFSDSPVFTTQIISPKLIGSVASGGTLTLQSTSNATKGKILFGNSVYDEVNNRLGILNATPAYELDVTGTARITQSIKCSTYNDNTNSSNLATFGTSEWAIGYQNTLTIRNNLTSGVKESFLFQFGTMTGRTASTEVSSWKILNGTTAWANGNFAMQRFNYITSSTGAFVSGTNTIDDCFQVYVDAPTAGAFAVFTRKWALGLNGNLALFTAGSGIAIKEGGTTARMGTCTLIGGTVTISNTSATANTRIIHSRQTNGVTNGNISYTIIAGTSFTLNSDQSLDNGIIIWQLIEKL